MRRFLILLCLGIGVASAACGSSSDSGVYAGGGASASAATDGGAATGGIAGTGATGGLGATGGSSAAAGDAGAGGSAASGGGAGDGGPPGCAVPSDCPSGQYCDAASGQCQAGCDEASDCAAPSPHCNVSTHQCAECVFDPDCGAGQICVGSTCTTGCSAAQPCPAGDTCCGSSCHNLTSDLTNCGSCGNACPPLPNSASACTGGQCIMAGCTLGFADCNADPTDGCEWNASVNGPCTCQPGSTQSCYFGPAGTENVGICKGGTQTCAPTGLGWSPCVGQVLPIEEVCANGIDEDCSGVADDVKDTDGDGWTKCQGDCCETVAQCSKPAKVNPGAYEVIGNGVDDDCDPSTSDTAPPAACSSAAKFSGVTAADVARAIDLCQFTTQNPPLAQKKWGVVSAQFVLANGATPNATQLANMQNYQAAVLANYGTGGIVPKNGPTMAGISSGRMRDQNDPGYVNPNSGTSFGSTSQPPSAYLAAHGGALPAAKGCSGNCPAGSGANDSINVKLAIRVPTNAESFSYQFRFFSAEYWTYQCTAYNDFYLALLTTGASGIPADKNISFDSLNNPVSVNNGFFDLCVPKGCNSCPAGTAELNGTGMQLSNTGGGTKWLTTTAPVVPGENMIIEFMVFDVSDGILDSLAILDNFTWKLDPSGVGTVD
jgi:hypothetical protein